MHAAADPGTHVNLPRTGADLPRIGAQDGARLVALVVGVYAIARHLIFGTPPVDQRMQVGHTESRPRRRI